MLWKCCTQYASKFGKLSSGHGTGKSQFSFQSQRKAMPKNAQTTAQLHSSHTLLSSVQFSRSGMSDSLKPHGLQHVKLPCPSPTPGAYSNSCPSSRWCHPAISSTVIPFSSSWAISNPKRWCYESVALNTPTNLKTQQWPRDWKRSVFIPIPKKGNAKECSNYHTIALISHASKVMLKIFQARLQQ